MNDRHELPLHTIMATKAKYTPTVFCIVYHEHVGCLICVLSQAKTEKTSPSSQKLELFTPVWRPEKQFKLKSKA